MIASPKKEDLSLQEYYVEQSVVQGHGSRCDSGRDSPSFAYFVRPKGSASLACSVWSSSGQEDECESEPVSRVIVYPKKSVKDF